ncbi:hypothetical protein T484DRAFT_1858672 [Baffinella frigidus]|nr:hypothetical protein T484DRAFT_1858672 [Cryptophyta sp. CCMP2293]
MDDRGGAKEVDVRRAASLVSEAGALRAAVTERRDALRGHIADLERAGEHLWLDPTDAVAAQQVCRGYDSKFHA